jgi:hypothetical protein
LRFRREIALFAAMGILISMVSLESVAKAAAPKCADVLVLGARGSGEWGPGTKPVGKSKAVWPIADSKAQLAQLAADPHGLGSELNAIWNQLNFHILIEQHRTAEVRSVNFPALDVGISGIMKPPHPFFQGIAQGVDDARKILKEAAKTSNCPNQWIILAGYSQGAMVMHRLLQGMSQDPGDRSFARVVGTILIADGDQNAYDNTTRMGSALKSATGVAVNFDTFSGASPIKFDSSLKSHIFSVCTQLDIVCDNWPGLVLTYAHGYRVHLSYTKNLLYLAAADQVASDLSPLPKGASQCAAPLRAATDCVKTPTVGPTDQPTPSGVAPTYAIGDTGPAGGKIFITPSTSGNTTGQYFEAAPADLSGEWQWCDPYTYGQLYPLLGASGTTIGTGAANTAIMLATCRVGASFAAHIYSTINNSRTYSDWCLPSKDELNQLYVSRAYVGGFGTGSTSYWSSSEAGTEDAWYQHFDDGYQASGLSKAGLLYVRPVRAFS